SPPTARPTCPTSAKPPTPCSTFANPDAIRVPNPAPKIIALTSRDIASSRYGIDDNLRSLFIKSVPEW
ncbi:MAG TPA: hypothetical protein VHM01_14435, partial [Alphaproteobacteria bacterium]|nr:hypothetical protein [Alphaproteobacteria bacterium]